MRSCFRCLQRNILSNVLYVLALQSSQHCRPVTPPCYRVVRLTLSYWGLCPVWICARTHSPVEWFWPPTCYVLLAEYYRQSIIHRLISIIRCSNHRSSWYDSIWILSARWGHEDPCIHCVYWLGLSVGALTLGQFVHVLHEYPLVFQTDLF